MHLTPQLIPNWPKLAWVASIREGTAEVRVLHGPMVEVADEWIVEAVWAGDFEKGDFDQTDLVFGSGIRVRGEKVIFVSAGSMFDRLFHCRKGDYWYVANSLPALLTSADLELRSDYTNYSRDVRSMIRGLEDRVRTLPTTSVDVTSIYYNNLVFDRTLIEEVSKPDTAPAFASYNGYYEYLVATAKSLGANASDSSRSNPVGLLSGISNGYDSCATATISRHAGCKDTVTIRDSTSLWRGSDSGAPVARVLGMSCREYPRTLKAYPLEESIWAAEGRPGIMNWTQFDYSAPLCLFFTGCHGEKLWDRVSHDHPDPFVRRDPSSLGFCEYRLLQGAFQCPMPFWAVRHNQELRAVTATDEMRPWYMNRDHDKPIARRIVEDEGVPREAFGLLNKNTSLERPFYWPMSPGARRSFGEYLKKLGRWSPSGFMVSLMRRAALVDALVSRNVLVKIGIKRGTPWWRRYANSLPIFQWANHELKKQYANGLEQAGISPEEWSDAGR